MKKMSYCTLIFFFGYSWLKAGHGDFNAGFTAAATAAIILHLLFTYICSLMVSFMFEQGTPHYFRRLGVTALVILLAPLSISLLEIVVRGSWALLLQYPFAMTIAYFLNRIYIKFVFRTKAIESDNSP